MSICLATTWYPRGELARFTRLLPMLEEKYVSIVVALVQDDDAEVMKEFASGNFSTDKKLIYFVSDYQRSGRYMALKKAVEVDADFVHYADMDRLLRWVETQPQEWNNCLEEIDKSDCTIFGRTPAAYQTHPKALFETEKISNQVVSYFMDREMDVSAGSKSFSRVAAKYLVELGTADNSISTDAEWPILLKQAGYGLQYLQVAGLDWESADQFQPRAAVVEEQKQAALAYDSDPAHWARRVEIANQIIEKAFQVASKKPFYALEEKAPQSEFDFEAVFGVDDYIYFYQESLTDERTETEVGTLVRLLELNSPKKILDLACGYGRHTNRLASLGHQMTGIDITPGFLEIARQDAKIRQVEVDYMQGDMRSLSYTDEFDCILLLFSAFGYFDDEVNLQVLINIRKALKSGGSFIFDMLNRDVLLKNLPQYYVVEREGNLMIDRHSFDSLRGRIYNKRVVFRDGMRKEKPFFQRLYNASELRSLLLQAGMELHKIYAGWEDKEFSSDARRMMVIAKKP